MKPKAITEANVRLERARIAVTRLEAMGFNFPELEAAWWNFLVAANGIYVKLEQGAKGSGRSEAWFGRVAHVRKKDELLSYIHHARNSEEHSLDGSTFVQGITAISPGGTARITNDEKGIHIFVKVGEPMDVQLLPPMLKVLSVTDKRFGDTFQPPTSHLGKPLVDQSPQTIARAAFHYLESLIAEGAEFV